MQARKTQRVDDRFHATFSATSRPYLYILPLAISLEPLQAQGYAIALQDTLQSVAVGNELDYKA
jgi:tRNA U38,U39,U40 pseudouridine synthase TruA